MASKRSTSDKPEVTPAKRGRRLQQVYQNLTVTVPNDNANTGNVAGLSAPNQSTSTASPAGVQQAPLLGHHTSGPQQGTCQQPAMPGVWLSMWYSMQGQYMMGQPMIVPPQVLWMSV